MSFYPWSEQGHDFLPFLREPQAIEILKEMGFPARIKGDEWSVDPQQEDDAVVISWFFSTRPPSKEVLALRERTEKWRQKEIERLKKS